MRWAGGGVCKGAFSGRPGLHRSGGGVYALYGGSGGTNFGRCLLPSAWATTLWTSLWIDLATQRRASRDNPPCLNFANAAIAKKWMAASTTSFDACPARSSLAATKALTKSCSRVGS